MMVQFMYNIYNLKLQMYNLQLYSNGLLISIIKLISINSAEQL